MWSERIFVGVIKWTGGVVELTGKTRNSRIIEESKEK
jgi:hypothetical protein